MLGDPGKKRGTATGWGRRDLWVWRDSEAGEVRYFFEAEQRRLTLRSTRNKLLGRVRRHLGQAVESARRARRQSPGEFKFAVLFEVARFGKGTDVKSTHARECVRQFIDACRAACSTAARVGAVYVAPAQLWSVREASGWSPAVALIARRIP